MDNASLAETAAEARRRSAGGPGLMSTLTLRLTVNDAAAVGKRHPVTIRRALEVGDLHGKQRKKGGRWLIQPECLEAWIDQDPCPHQEATVTDLGAHRAARTLA